MSTTQQQIADNLSLSLRSVARALNGENKVSEQNRERVLAMARELGYDESSNREARGLIAKRYGRRIRHNAIAVILNEYGAPLRIRPYYAPILDGIEVEANERRLDVYFAAARDDGLPRLVRDGYVDGVIYTVPGFLCQKLHEIDVPVVTTGWMQTGFHGLVPDDAVGIHLATRHLIERGHRRIAYLGSSLDFEIAIDRLAAYRKTMRDSGLEIDDALVDTSVTSQSVEAGALAMERLLDRNDMPGQARPTAFTAVVAYNDMLAMGAVRRLQAAGLRVPEDIAVTGFDDISVQENFAPAITSLAFDRFAMGRRAVQIICDFAAGMENGGAVAERHETMPVRLEVRASTCGN